MYTVESTNRTIGLAVTTAMASVMLAGCAGGTAPQASVSAEKAEQAIASGKHMRAIEHAEAAVAAEPRNVEFRATLGQAYLDAGRFASAATTFQDAIDLGDTSARTTLSLALAMTAEGRLAEADALLQASRGQIATADLGLAMALAGNPNGAVHLMSNAIRGGQNTVKMRQNLAYAYALAGRWRESRLMVAQDVPGDMVGARMEEWASQVHPQAYRQRLAALLDVPAGTMDNGQPLHLALSNNPSVEMLAEQAVADSAPQVAAFAPVEATAMTIESVELPPADTARPFVEDTRYQPIDTSRPANFAAAFKPDHAPAPAAPVAQNAAAFAAPAPVPVQRAATSQAATRAPRPVRAAAPATQSVRVPASVSQTPVAARADGDHLIQLGSFFTEAAANRAWTIYKSRYPELTDDQKVITQANVRGKRYFRVSAAGFDKSGSRAMCGQVRSAGGGCITWAEGSPLPGALARSTHFAMR